MKKKDLFVTVVVISIITSALIGGFFGYFSSVKLFKESLNSSGQERISRRVLSSEEESAAAVNAVKVSQPSVVSVVAEKNISAIERGTLLLDEFCGDWFFRNLFEYCESVDDGGEDTRKAEVGAGTGFVVSESGLIVTNKHVVDIEGVDLSVVTSGGKIIPAKLIAKDPYQDIAILKVEASGLPMIELGDSDAIEIGQTVLAIGNALGQFSNSVSKGIVSGLSRNVTANMGISDENLDELIQTDAAINPGNSGGPLLDLDGRVIGINTAIVSGAQNVGFAIPVNRAKKIIQDIEQSGRIVYPYLGVRYYVITPDLRIANDLPVDYGVWLTSDDPARPAVIPGSPAEKAGLQADDIIIEIEGEKIDEDNSLAGILNDRNVNDTVSLKVLRDGNELTLRATLEENKE